MIKRIPNDGGAMRLRDVLTEQHGKGAGTDPTPEPCAADSHPGVLLCWRDSGSVKSMVGHERVRAYALKTHSGRDIV